MRSLFTTFPYNGAMHGGIATDPEAFSGVDRRRR